MSNENFYYQSNSIELMEKIFLQSEWWYNNPSTELMLDTKLSACPFWTDDIWLTGHDKPHLFQHQGRWFCMTLHQSILDSMHLDNVIWFYGPNTLCPELLISQSRLARDFLIKNGFKKYRISIILKNYSIYQKIIRESIKNKKFDFVIKYYRKFLITINQKEFAMLPTLKKYEVTAIKKRYNNLAYLIVVIYKFLFGSFNAFHYLQKRKCDV